MPKNTFFVDRRRGRDRRLDTDPCKDLPVDLYHRKRRKSTDRRAPDRTLIEDYYAYMNTDVTPLGRSEDREGSQPIQ